VTDACEGLIDSSGIAVGFEERREAAAMSASTATAETRSPIKGRKGMRLRN
jgi:hypothetical protein